MTSARHSQRGLTLLELVVVLVVLGAVSMVAMGRRSIGETTARSQAEALASDLRHAQALASTWGRSLRVSVTAGVNGSYRVSCVNAAAVAPCNASPVLHPATGTALAISLRNGVALSGPASVDIDSFGRPASGASFVVSAGTASYTVSVAALTGHVSVAP